MQNLNLNEIYQEIEKFSKDRDWDQFHSVKNLTMALSIEAGELMELFQWMPEEKSNQVKNDPALRTKIDDEIADVFIYLLRLVDKTNTNLDEAVRNKMKKNIAKYPVELAKGNSKKYDEY